jgi:hypothetical protein
MFVDIEKFVDIKMAAIECYAGEMRPSPHGRSKSSVVILYQYRGNSVGLDAAESFQVLQSFQLM